MKEAAAWALGYIARHNTALAQSVVDNGAVPQLILCLQEPEISLKRIAASALSDIAKHTPELAQVDFYHFYMICSLFESRDIKSIGKSLVINSVYPSLLLFVLLCAILSSCTFSWSADGGGCWCHCLSLPTNRCNRREAQATDLFCPEPGVWADFSIVLIFPKSRLVREKKGETPIIYIYILYWLIHCLGKLHTRAIMFPPSPSPSILVMVTFLSFSLSLFPSPFPPPPAYI